MRADDLLPDVLADRHADLHALELDRLGHRPRREDALLVERAVIGKLALQCSADHPSAVREDQRIVGRAALADDRADEDCRARLDRRCDQLVGAFVRSADELGLQDQILGRIADQLELRAQQQVGTRRPPPHLEHRRGIALEVADALVHLREGDLQRSVMRMRPLALGPRARNLCASGSAAAKAAQLRCGHGAAHMKLLAGNSNLPLARSISDYLEMPLTDASVRRFADEEVFVEINENVRGEDVFVIQSTSYPANDNLMELLICIDALRRASAKRITAVLPYFGYARQDRKPGPRTPISAKLVANLITTAGANRVLSIDLHAGQIQGFFDIPTDNLFASPVIATDIHARFGNRDLLVVSPDVGGVVRARGLAKRLNNAPLAIVDKRRERAGESEVMNIIGDVEGRTCILIDDIVDSAGTLVQRRRRAEAGGRGRGLRLLHARRAVRAPPRRASPSRS